MPLNSFISQLKDFGSPNGGPETNLSDDEIEKAIKEIRAAIGKVSK